MTRRPVDLAYIEARRSAEESHRVVLGFRRTELVHVSFEQHPELTTPAMAMAYRNNIMQCDCGNIADSLHRGILYHVRTFDVPTRESRLLVDTWVRAALDTRHARTEARRGKT